MTGSTNRSTPARRGSAWGSRTPSTSRTSSSTRATRRSSTSPRSARCGAPAVTAASTRRLTAARPGSLILKGDERYTGATDLVMDPKKPDTIYVAMLQRMRQVGQLVGGGPGSGLYKSTDGGKNFTKLTKGLPTVEMGRTGSRHQPEEPEHGLRARHRAEGPGRILPVGRCGRELDADRPQRQRRRRPRPRGRRRGAAAGAGHVRADRHRGTSDAGRGSGG